MDIRRVLKGVEFRAGDGIGRLDIKGVSDDSRNVLPGWLFIARNGYDQDGSRFISDAVKNGAIAVVAEARANTPANIVRISVRDMRSALSVIADNFYSHPSKKIRVVGVTGTNGKTTVTYIIESILKAAGKEAGVIGTINYRFKGKVIPAKNTTPGSVELQSMMADMAARGVKYAVLEVSSHSLDQGRADRILFDAAVFTNVTGDHLDYHKTMSRYFSAKKRLFGKLKPNGVAVLNKDDKRVASLEGVFKRQGKKVITYGGRADVRAEDVRLSMDGTSFNLIFKKRSFKVRTGLIGMHNVSNILAAFAASVAIGIPEKAILQGISRSKDVPGRLEAVDEGQPFKVFVDFAHTEDAILNVLKLLRGVAPGRIITVFGCGGDRDRTKRPRMGKAACSLSDRVIITSDNPRSEDPMDIIRQIELGIREEFSNYDIVADRRKAIERAVAAASDGDIVILAGKGHESCQIMKDETLPFDDREVAKDILREKYRAGLQGRA
jgi:UDP-N-acetylmuramyl-tripeptide synthetase